MSTRRKGKGSHRPDTAASAVPAVAKPAAAAPSVRSRLDDARLQHGPALQGSLYRHQLKSIVGDDKELAASATAYVADLLGEFRPRDPAERMLVGQMIQTHARIMYLNTFAHQQSNLKWASMMNEAADRASNTFRRQMLALAEYRRPPRPARQFTAIGQANIAQQQVVQNQEKTDNENTTTEQGCAPRQPPALRPDARGTGSPAPVGQTGAPVGAEHWPADGGGQGGGEPERAAAR